jgi:aldehyde dehydrogenase (NAD+)
MKPETAGLQLPLKLALDSACIQREPLGCVLVIGTWNYPLATALGPMLGAVRREVAIFIILII